MRGIARFLSKPSTLDALVFLLAAAAIILVALRRFGTSCGQALHRFDINADETGLLQQQPHPDEP